LDLLLLLLSAGLYPAMAAACETEASILQQLLQQYKQQRPEEQRSLENYTVVLLSQHFNVAKWLLSLWMFTANAALNFTRFSSAFAPVAVPLSTMAMQLLLACSAVTAAISSSSSGGGGSAVHPLAEAAKLAMSQVFFTSDRICVTVGEGAAVNVSGQNKATTMQIVSSDHVLRLQLMLLAAATEQLYARQRCKLRKAAAAAGSSSASSSSTAAAAAAATELPEPHHQQLFAALGLPATDPARSSDTFLKGSFFDSDAIYRVYTCVSAMLMYKQEQRVNEPLIRGGSCRGGPAGSRNWSINGSSSSSSAAENVPDPVVPADLLRPLLLTALEACLLDSPLNVVSSCSELLWVALASSAWLPGGQPAGSATAAAAAAAVQMRQQLGGPAGVQELLQLMLQQAGPVVIAAHRQGKLVGVLRREDEAGAIKGHSRSVGSQGYGDAVISLACSGKD
jgi:hypothetical protein